MKAYELLEDMKLQKQVDTLKERLAKVEIAEAKARIENEELKELLMQMMQNGLEVKYVGGGDD